jgi:hypothetical protein
MTRAFVSAMGGLLAMLAVIGVTPAIGADVMMNSPRGEEGSDSSLDRRADGLQGIAFGLGVSPLRSQFRVEPPSAATGLQNAEPAGFLDSDSKALSFNLKLRWPGTDKSSLVEPYVNLGPTLFVIEPDYLRRLVGARPDASYRLGAQAGAGVNLHLGKNADFFTAYEATSRNQSAVPSLGAKTPTESGLSGFDFTYGLRLRY